MKKLFVLCFALIAAAGIALPAHAQMLSGDIVFLKAGYIPVSETAFKNGLSYTRGTSTSYDSGITLTDVTQKGWALQGEYNLNIHQNVWIGFGLEYQRLKTDEIVITYSLPGYSRDTISAVTNQYVQPMVSLKFVAVGGLYIGGGFSVKYLMSSTKVTNPEDAAESYEWKSEADLWANAVMGYFFPVSEGVYLNLEGRFGYSLTNNQFKKIEGVDGSGSYTIGLCPKRTYDIAFYAGFGFRTRMGEF